MTESTTVEANVTPAASDSRTLDDSSNSNALGRGVHLPEAEQKQEEAKPISTRDAIAKAWDEANKPVEEKAKEAVEDAKAKVAEAEKAPKVEKPRAEDGKFAKAQTEQPVDAKADKGAAEQPASERAAPEDRQSEGRRYQEPPARFLPEAREKWANVPSTIKAEFHRVSQEMEAETAKYRQSHERYEQLRQYDDTARQNGRDLTQSLAKVVEVERAIAQNPIAGLDAVLREIGPRKADGTPLTLLEVAQHIVQNPQAYHQSVQAVDRQPAQQQQQRDPEIEALRNEIQSMKAQAVIPVIDRFIDEHPDYHALEPQIEAILKSGVIEQIYGNGLSPVQKLAESYRMAGGRAPSQSVAQQEQPAPVQPQQARLVDPDGEKSIKGAPTNGKTAEGQRRFKSNREALQAAFDAHAR